MPRNSVVRSVSLIAGLALIVALSACTASQAVTVGDAAKPTKSAAPVDQGAKRVLSAAEVPQVLPTAAEMGLTWVDGKSPNATGDDSSTNAPTFAPSSCAFTAADGTVGSLAIVPITTKPAATATADFHTQPASDDTLGLDIHSASVTVSSYKDDVGPARLTEIAAKLKTCATFTATDSSSGVTSNWQIVPVSLPNYGDGTLAFRLQGSVGLFVVLIDLVQIAAGHNLITITQSGIGAIDTNLGAIVSKTVMTHLESVTK